MASRLDRPETQQAVLDAIEAGAKADAAAAVAGVSRQAVAQYAKAHPDFRARVEAARGRTRVVARQGPRAHELGAPATVPTAEQVSVAAQLGVRVELVEDLDAVTPGPSAAAFVAWCWATAKSDDQPPAVRGKALEIVAQYTLGPVIRAQAAAERRAELDAETHEGVLVIELPRNGTHAQGRRAADEDVLEGEVVEDAGA